jgi:hypothetical protein
LLGSGQRRQRIEQPATQLIVERQVQGSVWERQLSLRHWRPNDQQAIRCELQDLALVGTRGREDAESPLDRNEHIAFFDLRT